MKERKMPHADRTAKAVGLRKSQMTQVLAAASLLSVSLGMNPVYADDCAAGQQCGQTSNGAAPTGQYTRKKLPGRMKSGTLTVTRGAIGAPTSQSDSSSTPGTSNQNKLDSTANTNKGGNNMMGNHKDVMDTVQPPTTTPTTTPHSQPMSGNHKDVMGTVQPSTSPTNQK